MPYIRPGTREYFDPRISELDINPEMTKGDINYVLSTVVAKWVAARAEWAGRLSYDIASDGHSVLQDAAAEFYRRVVAPYEDQKIAENGDVYQELV